MGDTQITLISKELAPETTDTGEAIETETFKTIFAEERGVKRNEFYQAQALGLRPQLTFLIFSFEYSGEKTVEYKGERYNVIRTYPAGGERLELICNTLTEVG